MAARLALLAGEQWWANIGNMHTPDSEGNRYCRTFAEERAGYVKTFFCTDKPLPP